MNHEGKDVGCFYCNFKVHKPHTQGKTPPERPITSQSGSMCKNIGSFIDHHIKHIGKKHESYLQDIPDFLRTNKPTNRNNTILEGKGGLFAL